jgi:hypothetical protein
MVIKVKGEFVCHKDDGTDDFFLHTERSESRKQRGAGGVDLM